jgi:hypothetical protein
MLTLHVHTSEQSCPRTGTDRADTIRLSRATDAVVRPRHAGAWRAAWLALSGQPNVAVDGTSGQIWYDGLRIELRVEGLAAGSRITVGNRQGLVTFTADTVCIPFRVATGTVANPATRAGRITVVLAAAGGWTETIARDIVFLAKPTVPRRDDVPRRARKPRRPAGDKLICSDPWAAGSAVDYAPPALDLFELWTNDAALARSVSDLYMDMQKDNIL